MMSCNDCGKSMSGGFGIGERPFSKFLCADCVIRNNHNAQCKWALDEIIKMIDEPILASGRCYKHKQNQYFEKLMRIKALARLVVEGK